MEDLIRTERLELRPVTAAVVRADMEGHAALAVALGVARTTDRPALVGLGSFRGPPVDGAAELGYCVVESCQRRGYATEAVAGMVAWALERGVHRVVAHTLRGLTASITVLERNGFGLVGDGEEPGTIRFERAG